LKDIQSIAGRTTFFNDQILNHSKVILIQIIESSIAFLSDPVENILVRHSYSIDVVSSRDENLNVRLFNLNTTDRVKVINRIIEM